MVTELTTTRLIPESADRPGDDPIFTLNAEAGRRAAAGEDVLNATLGALMEDDGRLAVMPSVFEARQRIDPARASAYAPISGPPTYLRAVITDLFGDGPLAEQAIAVATPGGTGAIHHAIVNFIEPGQSLLTTSYYWSPYGIIANHAGRRLRTFSMFRRDGAFDADALDQELAVLLGEQGRALIILNTPCHNPTGYSLDEDDWGRLVEVLEARSQQGPIALLLDLAYLKFAGPGSRGWLEQAARLAGKVSLLFAWTASKAFAQYGARIGACVAVEPDEAERLRVMNALGYSCRSTWSNCNHLGMLTVTEILSDPELRRRSEKERGHLVRLLDERVTAFNALAPAAGIETPRYEGGFFVAAFTADPKKTCAVMREQGVFVVPLQGAVRVALCATPAEKIPRLVAALKQGIDQARG